MSTDGEWETGRRQGPPWRVVGAVLLVALVAGAAWAARDGGALPVETTTESAEGSEFIGIVVAEPPSGSGGRWACAGAVPHAAYADGTVYPPQHPDKPTVAERPAVCFAELDAALAEGYDLAPPPDGSEVAGDLYLVDARAEALCRDGAGQVGFAVPCPGVLPAPAGRGVGLLRCAGTEGRCRYGDGYVLELSGFPVPPRWCDGCRQHVMFTAERRGTESVLSACDFAELDLLPAGDLLPLGYSRCGAAPPWITGNGGFPHESHLLYRFVEDDIVYGISVEGHGPPQREVLDAVREATTLVSD